MAGWGQLLALTQKAEAGTANNYDLIKIPSYTYSQPEVKKFSGCKIKPATFDGTGNRLEFF